MNKSHAQEINAGDRFEFGKNWGSFLKTIDEDRIESAQRSIAHYLGKASLSGQTFLDIGCGSGLFSLAARRMGASVRSFDFDPDSVRCAEELRRRYFPNDNEWSISEGSVLDPAFMKGLGKFDIVYSWGVLHHTGAMWQAIDLASAAVDNNGSLYIAIYNDQAGTSRRWLYIKKLYNRSSLGKSLVCATVIPYFVLNGLLVDLVKRTNPIHRFTHYKSNRGMSRMHDYLDWLGGLPFEVAKPEEIFHALQSKGFRLARLKTCGGGLGCNEFLFINVA